jgi:hypothetical protein
MTKDVRSALDAAFLTMGPSHAMEIENPTGARTARGPIVALTRGA